MFLITPNGNTVVSVFDKKHFSMVLIWERADFKTDYSEFWRESQKKIVNYNL